MLHPDPNELVEQARNGCEESFAELARQFFPRLVQLVLPRLHNGSHMDAEDVAQEALSRAFQKIDTFDPRFRFSTWLYTIALRIAIDHNRGYKRRQTLVDSKRSEMEIAAGRTFVQGTPTETMESVDAIWKTARRALSQTHYTAMWLRFSEDLSIEEIAKILNKTHVGVRVLLHRARTTMLKELSKEASYGSYFHARESRAST